MENAAQNSIGSPASAINYLLQHMGDRLNQQLDQALFEQLGIGMAQFKILTALQTTPSVKQNELAHQLGQTEASISRQIKILQAKGMLAAEINPKNRRAHLTHPTIKGLRLVEAAREVLLQTVAPMAGRLTDNQQHQLIKMLGNLHDWICPPNRSSSCNHPFDI
jgi:MarR family transcriptional regulator, organic hydroperoxide resistance regulator